MSKNAIKRLSKAHESYDITVSATTLSQLDTANKPIQVPAFQVTITIFSHTEKGAVISKKASAYGLEQDSAIEAAVDRLGV